MARASVVSRNVRKPATAGESAADETAAQETCPFNLDVAFDVAHSAFIALSGPSGVGKTTLLRLIAGLAQPDAGKITVGDDVWCDTSARHSLATRKRPIGFVFQDYPLFPNMTARQNIEYALGRRHEPGRATELLELVSLENLQHIVPARLSGGQKQRLALVRALARRPSILLLDEPLSALDPMMRRRLQDELKKMHRDFGTTTFLVSHDLSEILRLADRVLQMDEGRIVFDGPPAGMFASTQPTSGLQMLAKHIEGPDENGVAKVQLRRHSCP
jgi:molybdate transport system ATP-binding protein